jgi:hypothetical protein
LRGGRIGRRDAGRGAGGLSGDRGEALSRAFYF